jgi:DNA invertase Pin-like site-specific DNA recombinase
MPTATQTLSAVIYLRVSQDHTGEHATVDRHREDCLKVATARGWTVIEEYVDNDISAAGKRVRPAFDAMLDRIETGQVDVVLAWMMDRLHRNRRDELRLIEALQKHKVLLSFARGSDLDVTTPMGEQMADFMAMQARAEIRIKGDRQRRAQQQRAEKGRPAKGIRPTGYALDGSIIEAEAKVVRWIFDQFVAGDSLKGIATALERNGIATRRGGRWSSSTVLAILRNARYAGRSIYKGADLGAAQWEPLVTEAQFSAAQVRLDDPTRKTHGDSTDRRHLGSGLYFCTCGLRVRASSGIGAGLARYTCRHNCHYRSGRPIDDLVLAVVRGRLAMPDLRELLAKPADKDRLRALATERKDLDLRLGRFQSDYDAGLIDGRRLHAATTRTEARLAEIRSEEARMVAQHAPDSVLAAADPVAAFDASPLTIQRQIVDALVRVTLHKGKHGSKHFDPDSVTVDLR